MNSQIFISLLHRASIPAIFSLIQRNPAIFKNFVYNALALESYRGISQRVEQFFASTFPEITREWQVAAGAALATSIVWTVARQADHDLGYFFWGIMALNSIARAYIPHKDPLSGEVVT